MSHLYIPSAQDKSDKPMPIIVIIIYQLEYSTAIVKVKG